MKTAILYYTLTGNNKKIAEALSEKLKADVKKLEAPPLLMFAERFVDVPDTSKYDRVIVSGPVWAGKPCPAVSAAIKRGKIKNKKVDVILTQLDPKNTSAANTVKTILPKAKVHTICIGEFDKELKKLLKNI